MKLQPKIAIYLRTATHGQDSHQKLQDQESACRQFMDRHFPHIASAKGAVVVYQDLGHSAMDMKRPGLLELLRDVKTTQIKTIITTDMIRLFRRPQDAAFLHSALSEHNATAYTIDGNVLGADSTMTKNVGVQWLS